MQQVGDEAEAALLPMPARLPDYLRLLSIVPALAAPASMVKRNPAIVRALARCRDMLKEPLFAEDLPGEISVLDRLLYVMGHAVPI
jgi:hypothetical protein